MKTQALFSKLSVKSFFILIFLLIGFSAAYSQDAETEREITEAIENAQSGKYEQAIPVLKKYVGFNEFDDLTKVKINIYLNFCFLATKEDTINIEKINTISESYIEKYGVSKSDTKKRNDEIISLFYISAINGSLGNNAKMVSFLSIVKHEYDEENLDTNDGVYSEVLRLLTRGYYYLENYKSAIEIGQIAYELNTDIWGENNNTSLEILDLLYLSYNSINQLDKALPYLQKEVEIGKNFWGEKNPEYLSRLKDLGATYSNLGNFEKALEIDLKVVELYKEVFGEGSAEYLTSLNSLSLAYSNNGEDDKALNISLDVVKLQKEILGVNDPKYLNSLNNLASIYLDLGDFSKALEISLEVLELSKKVLGEKHPDYAKRLGVLALVYSKQDDYQKALELNLNATTLLEEILGVNNPDYFTSLSNLAVVYSKLGEYQKALESDLKVTRLRKEILGENHPEYLTSLANLASDYLQLGDFSKSLEINLENVELLQEVLSENHPAYLTALSNLAYTYSSLGNYPKALEISIRVVELMKEIHGEVHPSYLISLLNLSSAYLNIGDFQKALELGLIAEKLYLEVFGSDNPNYFNSLGNLVSIYLKLGDYQTGMDVNFKVINFRREFFGEKHPEYIKSLGSLSSSYLFSGNYLKALETSLVVTELSKKVLGEHHPTYLTSLTILALIYSNLGDYQEALGINLKTLEIGNEVLGEDHPHNLVRLNNLGLVYSEIGNYPKALEIYLKGIEIGNRILGEKHPGQLTSLANLAIVYSKTGDYQKALDIDIEVTELRKEVLGENHPNYIAGLGNLATDYSRLGNHSKSLELNEKVAVLLPEVLGERHPDYIIALIKLALSEFNFSKKDFALTHFRKSLNLSQERVFEYIGLLTEYQREKYWKETNRYFNLFPMFLEEVINSRPEEINYSYDLALFTKGLLLNTTLDFEYLIFENGTPESIVKYKDLKLLKLQIQKLYERPIAERYLNVDSLETVAQKLETELVKLSKEYGDYTQNLKITWKEVQANLGEKDVAIEFLEYPTLTDTVKYAALVLRKGWANPKFVPLFRKDQSDEFIKRDPNQIYSNGFVGKEIKKLIWNPLEEFIAPGENVYFSAAGIMHQLAIENLSDDDSTTLGDRYQMHRLSSTKELVIKKPESKSKSVALFGGIKYDIALDSMLAEGKKFERRNDFLALRGINQDTLGRKGWQFLPGTLAEANEVSQILNKNRYQISEYIGETGSEESFKDLSGKRTGIIHIATHGFFLPVEQSKGNPFIQMRFDDDRNDNAGYVDPMLRSGLLLAGGNRAWQGDSIPDTIEDGVLTAKEISHIDMRGTDLVVLSACETGLGDVSSEGVFGLQRAFKQAGAQTIIMSLWNVKDEATQFLMTSFYSYLTQGISKREAFIQARNKCKERYPDPASWAAFIMLD